MNFINNGVVIDNNFYNYDDIRKMSDEELQRLFNHIYIVGYYDSSGVWKTLISPRYYIK